MLKAKGSVASCIFIFFFFKFYPAKRVDLG